jgi:hypothetical protein
MLYPTAGGGRLIARSLPAGSEQPDSISYQNREQFQKRHGFLISRAVETPWPFFIYGGKYHAAQPISRQGDISEAVSKP